MYPCLMTARIWDEETKKLKNIHFFTFVENFVQAAEKAEKYCGDAADTLTIELLEEGEVIKIGPMTAEHIRKDDMI